MANSRGRVRPAQVPTNTQAEAQATKAVRQQAKGVLPATKLTHSNGAVAVRGTKQSGGAKITGGSV